MRFSQLPLDYNRQAYGSVHIRLHRKTTKSKRIIRLVFHPGCSTLLLLHNFPTSKTIALCHENAQNSRQACGEPWHSVIFAPARAPPATLLLSPVRFTFYRYPASRFRHAQPSAHPRTSPTKRTKPKAACPAENAGQVLLDSCPSRPLYAGKVPAQFAGIAGGSQIGT
jgi:hypothetical protein